MSGPYFSMIMIKMIIFEDEYGGKVYLLIRTQLNTNERNFEETNWTLFSIQHS